MCYHSSFVVKVLVDKDHKMRRGYVQHIGTQDAIRFLTMDKMVDFIMGHLSPIEDQNDESGAEFDQDILAPGFGVGDEEV
jgi:hypothetical protein